MATSLPKIEINGEAYFVDKRLSQVRNVNNPHDFEDISPELVEFWEINGWLFE